MEISAPTNWDFSLIGYFAKLNGKKEAKTTIKEIYGSMAKTIIGSARSPSLSVSDAKEEKVENYIKKSKKSGFLFNYLINSFCTGNLEYQKEKKKEIIDYLKWIESTGASFVTVANPFLLSLAKGNTNLKIVYSVIADARGINKIRLLEADGIERIVLSTSMNRNFFALKRISESANCGLELLANESCLLDCPYRFYHYLVSSHDSQTGSKSSNFDYCLAKCSLARLKDLSQIIKAPWIRPEDIEVYSKFNVGFLKLSGRIMPTEWIKNCVKAYAFQNYNGNLYDIIDQQGLCSSDFSRFCSEISKLNVFVDNKKLSSFIPKLSKLNRQCGIDCSKCSFCSRIAKETIIIDEKQKVLHEKRLETVLKKGLQN